MLCHSPSRYGVQGTLSRGPEKRKENINPHAQGMWTNNIPSQSNADMTHALIGQMPNSYNKS